MAVLLVAMSIAAVMMTVAMPVWKQMSQREKEEELVFRGQQYVRALRLFGMKYANASPPNLDLLVDQHFLRRKYKDPITNDDFQVILAGQQVQGSAAGPGSGGAGTSGRGGTPTAPSLFGSGVSAPAAIGGQTGQSAAPLGRGTSPIGTPGAGPAGGIIGVASKSKDKSIKLYNGRTHYNEWAFIFTAQTQTPGVAAPGQRGGQQGQPGQNPFGSGIGGQRRGGPPNNPSGPPGGRPGGPGPFPSPFPSPPGRPGAPGTTPNPFQPGQPAQPIQPGRGRGN